MERYFNINEDKHSIKCKVYFERNDNIKNIILFCHGFGGSKDNNAASNFAQKTLKKHRDTVIVTFNWPSHGDDVKKKIRLEDCDEYLSIVIKYIKDRWKTDIVYCYGTSFGGYCTLKHIKEHENPFKKIALRCPAVCMHDVLMHSIMSKDEWEKIESGKDVLAGFDKNITVDSTFMNQLKENDITKLDYIDECEDILMIHGSQDEVVPYQTVYDFADQNIIELITVEGAEHRFRNVNHMNIANEAIWKFFSM